MILLEILAIIGIVMLGFLVISLALVMLILGIEKLIKRRKKDESNNDEH